MRIPKILELILRYGVGGAVALVCLPPVLVGGSDVSLWLHLQVGDPYYGNRNYLEAGLPVLLYGLGILALTIYLTVRRTISLQWLFVPFVLSILAAIAIPSLVPRSHQGAVRAALQNRLAPALVAWGREHSRFPQNQDELERAAEHWDGIRPGEQILSPYARRGQPVPYRFVYVGGASEPHLPAVLPQEPGVVYYAVSPDAKRFWLTATALEQEVSTSVVLLPQDGGQPNVVEGSLEAKPD